MYKRNIQRLTQTYLTLSLQDIANTVQLNSPKEAEMHVLQMVVSAGKILYYDIICIVPLTIYMPNFRSKMVRYLQQSTRRMEWLDS